MRVARSRAGTSGRLHAVGPYARHAADRYLAVSLCGIALMAVGEIVEGEPDCRRCLGRTRRAAEMRTVVER